jgi:hypothetical protein
MNTKHIHHIHPHSIHPFHMPFPTLTDTHLCKRPFYPPVLHFLKKRVLIIQGGFALAHQACVYQNASRGEVVK